MATNWQQEQNDAYIDLLEEGEVFTFVRTTNKKPDPISGKVEDALIDKFTAPGILKRAGGIKWKREFADLVKEGDEILLCAAKTYTPEIGDMVNIEGQDWRVENFTPLRPAVVALLHYLLIRKV